MTHCLIYARFSSEEQNPLSAADQITLCRDMAARHGLSVAGVFSDEAISGARRDRPGFDHMLSDIAAKGWQAGGFVVLAESLSRFARDLETTARLKRLTEGQNGRLLTHAEGEISLLHIGLKGTMNEIFLDDLKTMTRRGLNANLAAEKSTGGAVYGYKADASAPHGKAICQEQAAIIREIYASYMRGVSPLAIARDLNTRGVASPTGKDWRATTILGDTKRGTGILSNPIYAGTLIYGRQRNVKDPVTGRTLKRLNPEHLWKKINAPTLTIISEEDFAAVQRQKAERSAPGLAMSRAQRRPKDILSGAIMCAHCGHAFTRYDAHRLRCSSPAAGRQCGSNGWTVKSEVIKSALFDIISHDLLAANAVRAFQIEMRRAQTGENHSVEIEAIRTDLAATETAIENILKIIESGQAGQTPERLFNRLRDLESRADTLRRNEARLLSSGDQLSVIAGPENASAIRDMILQELKSLLYTPPDHEGQALFRGVVQSLSLKAPPDYKPRARKQRKPGVLRVTGGLSMEALRATSLNQIEVVPPPRFERGTSRSTI